MTAWASVRTAAASWRARAPSPAANGLALHSTWPSFGPSSAGARPARRSAVAPSSTSPANSARPSPMTTRPTWAIWHRSDAPIDPTSGITGCTRELSMDRPAGSRSPAALRCHRPRSPFTRASRAARTTGTGSGSPTALARPRTVRTLNSAEFVARQRVRRPAAEPRRQAVRRHLTVDDVVDDGTVALQPGQHLVGQADLGAVVGDGDDVVAGRASARRRTTASVRDGRGRQRDGVPVMRTAASARGRALRPS